MSHATMYPECLRRPDAGGHLQTRTKQTEKRYRKRYEGMARTWCRRHQVDMVTPFELAAEIGARACTLSQNALKQYHASIRQHLRDLWDIDAITHKEVERVDALLRQQKPIPKAVRGKVRNKTSAGRAKSIKPETLSALVAELLRSPTPIRRIAAAQLEYGVELATRPSEFLTIREDAFGRLWVRSAKYSDTNKKGLQRVRMLIVDTLDPVQIEELKDIASLLLTERTNGGTTNSLLRRCQHATRRARKAVGGRASNVTPYTARHQARANMTASGLTPEEVAVIMNHASAMTAQSHYAPARSAWKGAINATPRKIDPALVAKVRPGNRSRGWTAQKTAEPRPNEPKW